MNAGVQYFSSTHQSVRLPLGVGQDEGILAERQFPHPH